MERTLEHFVYVIAGDTRKKLRELFRILGILAWKELTIGSSYQQYRALDVYERLMVAGMQDNPVAVWFLLNTEMPPMQRMCPDPRKWYEHRFWEFFGQREVHFEQVLANPIVEGHVLSVHQDVVSFAMGRPNLFMRIRQESPDLYLRLLFQVHPRPRLRNQIIASSNWRFFADLCQVILCDLVGDLSLCLAGRQAGVHQKFTRSPLRAR